MSVTRHFAGTQRAVERKIAARKVLVAAASSSFPRLYEIFPFIGTTSSAAEKDVKDGTRAMHLGSRYLASLSS